MKIQFFALITILILVTPVLAQQAEIGFYTDRGTYFPGDKGTITFELETFEIIDDATLEIEIISPGGKTILNDMVLVETQTEIAINPNTQQTIQIIYREIIDHLDANENIRRTIGFEVPINAPSGTYGMMLRVRYRETVLETSKYLFFGGIGDSVDYIMIFYIVILIFSLYLLWRG